LIPSSRKPPAIEKYHQANMRVRRGFFIASRGVYRPSVTYRQSHETRRISLLRTPAGRVISWSSFILDCAFKCTASEARRM
jgi:hypothetical protein